MPIKNSKDFAKKIIDILKKEYPKVKPALVYSNPFELLIATILSAQCTDERVNIVTKTLFKKYKKPLDFIKLSNQELEKEIFSTGFYKQKAKSIKACCEELINNHKGKIPADFDELVKLSGVGRKTASVIAGNAFGIPSIAVDTHVKRLTKILGLTNNTDPVKIEKDLMQILPKEEWMGFSFRLVDYGRKYCSARNHNHQNCPLTKLVS